MTSVEMGAAAVLSLEAGGRAVRWITVPQFSALVKFSSPRGITHGCCYESCLLTLISFFLPEDELPHPSLI